MAKNKQRADTDLKKRNGGAREAATEHLANPTPLANQGIGTSHGSDLVEQQPAVRGGQFRTGRQPTDEGTTSYSDRHQQRDVLLKAAALRGWTPTSLIRTAALEKATHVLNLSVPNSFDFSGAAKRCAEVLVAPRTVTIADAVPSYAHAEWVGLPEGTALSDIPNKEDFDPNQLRLDDFRPKPLSPERVEELQEAIRLGGIEFANQLIVECRRLGSVANHPPNLPPPIDPQSLKY